MPHGHQFPKESHVRSQRRLSLPVACKDGDMGCQSDLQALPQRRAAKCHKQRLSQPQQS
jgi:hypothetical protein